MIQPVNLQLAHFNVEHAAQVSKDALAVVQQTGQVREVAEESVRNTQMVQASIASAETRKVKRRGEDEERERRRDRQGQSFKRGGDGEEDEYESAANEEEFQEVIQGGNPEEIQVKKAAKSFELYA